MRIPVAGIAIITNFDPQLSPRSIAPLLIYKPGESLLSTCTLNHPIGVRLGLALMRRDTKDASELRQHSSVDGRTARAGFARFRYCATPNIGCVRGLADRRKSNVRWSANALGVGLRHGWEAVVVLGHMLENQRQRWASCLRRPKLATSRLSYRTEATNDL